MKKIKKVYVVSGGSWDKTVKVWDALDGTLIKTLSGHTDCVYAACTFTDEKTQKVCMLLVEVEILLSKYGML